MQSKQKNERDRAPAFMTIPASCRYLSLSPASVYRLIGLDKLKAVKSGRRTLLTVASLKAYAASLPVAKIKPPTNRMGAHKLNAEPLDAA